MALYSGCCPPTGEREEPCRYYTETAHPGPAHAHAHGPCSYLGKLRVDGAPERFRVDLALRNEAFQKLHKGLPVLSILSLLQLDGAFVAGLGVFHQLIQALLKHRQAIQNPVLLSTDRSA
jgi:hypothetical protein